MSRMEKILRRYLEASLQGKRVRMPDAGTEILRAFLDLSRARTYHQHGPNPITWEALDAYQRITGQALPPKHSRIIMALDEVWLKDATRRMGEPSVKQAPPVASGPISSGSFDAMFG